MDQDEPHLLVVDDDARIRELLRRYLAGSGFRVTIAGDAAEARSKLASMEFDLVVLDVMMPGENGFDLTRSLRETEVGRKTLRTPILLLTAMAEPGDRITGLSHGGEQQERRGQRLGAAPPFPRRPGGIEDVLP